MLKTARMENSINISGVAVHRYYLEIPATLFGLINIYLLARVSMWNWIFGIASVALYILIFFDSKLYADMSLQFIFLGFQFYGWYQWLYGSAKHTALTVHYTPRRTCLILFPVFLCLFYSFVFLLSRYTDSTTVYQDSFVTALSLIAQWMLSKKLLENWILWIVVDVVAIVMYLAKGLYLTSLLYAIFIILCLSGLYIWRKSATTTC